MNKLIGSTIVAATAMVAAPAWSQAPQAPPPAPGFQATRYFELPLEKDASRIVRMQSVVLPAGSVPAGTVIAVAANAVVSVMGAPTFGSSTHATLMMDSVPLPIVPSGGVASSPVTSLFQTANVAVKMILDASWALRSAQGVAWMSNVLW